MTVYSGDESRRMVCDGAFGAPDGVKITFAAACDLAMATAGVVGVEGTLFQTLGCLAPAVHEKGWVAGAVSTAAAKACSYVAEIAGAGAALTAGGVTVDPLVGVAVDRGVTFVGDTVVCIGVGKVIKDVKSWATRWETDQEAKAARAVITRGKCLQDKPGALKPWTAISCPSGFAPSTPPSSRFSGHTADGYALTATLEPDGQSLAIKTSLQFNCSGWNPYGIWKLDWDFTRDDDRPSVDLYGTFSLDRLWPNKTAR